MERHNETKEPRSASPSSVLCGSVTEQKDNASSISILPGLLDELAILCLAMVPRAYHSALRQVNSSWAWLVNSGQLCRVRRLHGLTEPWVYLRSKDSQHRNTWRAFDLTTRTWHSLPPPPFPCQQVAADDAQTLGWNSQPGGEASEAGEDSRRRAAAAAASSQVRGLSSAVLHGRLFVFGGWQEGGPCLSSTFSFCPAANLWALCAPMGTARCYMASAVVGGCILVAGGMARPRLHPSEMLADAEEYDPVSNTWRSLPPLPRPMLFCTGLPFGDSFLVSGSFANNDELWGFSFCPLTRCWSEVTDRELASALLSPCSVAAGRFVFCMKDALQVWHANRHRWEVVPGEGSIFPDDGLPVSWVSSMACMEATVAGRVAGQDHSLPCSPRSPSSAVPAGSSSAAAAAASVTSAAASVTNAATCSGPACAATAAPPVPHLCLRGSCNDETQIDLILAHQNSSITRVLLSASLKGRGRGSHTGASLELAPPLIHSFEAGSSSSHVGTDTAVLPPRDGNTIRLSSHVGLETYSSMLDPPSLQMAAHSVVPVVQEGDGRCEGIGSREAVNSGLQWSVVAVEKMTAGLPLAGDEQVMDCFVLRA